MHNTWRVWHLLWPKINRVECMHACSKPFGHKNSHICRANVYLVQYRSNWMLLPGYGYLPHPHSRSLIDQLKCSLIGSHRETAFNPIDSFNTTSAYNVILYETYWFLEYLRSLIYWAMLVHVSLPLEFVTVVCEKIFCDSTIDTGCYVATKKSIFFQTLTVIIEKLAAATSSVLLMLYLFRT